MRGRIGGLVCAGVLLFAGEAEAEPVALLDAPRATVVALAGSEVLVGRPASRGAVRIDAVPIGGGPVRGVARMPRPRPGQLGRPVVIASSAQLVAAVVEFYGEHPIPARTQLWIGRPAGPLRREVDARFKTRAWLPVTVDVDGDRVLVVEARVPDLQFRARVLVPGALPHVVPWRGYLRPPAALAGDRIAFVGVGAAEPAVKVVDWRTGALIDRRPDGDVADLDLAADGRVVTAIEHEPFEAPSIAGDRIVALGPSRFDATRLVLLDPAGGPPAPLGLPTTQARGFAVDPSGAAWIANGCVLYAPLAGPPPTEPPPGPCPRAEMRVEGVDATLRGRRLRFRVACVAAPAAGCRGTVLVRGDELPSPGGITPIRGRGRFRVPVGARRRVDVVLTRRSIPYVRAALRRDHEASLAVRVRARDGRGYGDTGALIVRIRRWTSGSVPITSRRPSGSTRWFRLPRPPVRDVPLVPRCGSGSCPRLRRRLVRLDHDVGTVLVLEPVEHARHDESASRFLGVVDGVELQNDEYVVRVVDAAKHALHSCLLSGAWPILVEHGPPRVVVADLNPGDDECTHRRSLVEVAR